MRKLVFNYLLTIMSENIIKRRGRKKKIIGCIEDKELIFKNNIEEETLILILNISYSDIENKIEYNNLCENIVEEKITQDNETNFNIEIIDKKNIFKGIKFIRSYSILDDYNINNNNNNNNNFHHRNWPIKTDTLCWWCCHSFDSIPIPIPFAYTRSDIFKVHGCFCSFNCAKSYILKDFARYVGQKPIYLLNFLYKKVMKKNNYIKKAPPKEILKRFGGFLDIEDYRKSFDINTNYNIIKYPMIATITQVEESYVPDMNNLPKVIKKYDVERKIPLNKTSIFDFK